MTASSCPRSFEVEALRDGRLSGAERSHFERHLATCPACTREAEAFAELARSLERSYPLERDELLLRRQRTRLLADFDRSVTQPEPTRTLQRRALLGVAAVAVAAGALLWLRSKPSPAHGTERAAVEIRADEAARWTRRTGAERDVITLDAGSLHVRVRHDAARPPLLVLLPDGELEDTGTTFSVHVEGGRTRHVAVEEGSVVLRLRGGAPVGVGAGQAWTAPANSSPAPSAPPLEPPPSAAEPSATSAPRAEPSGRGAASPLSDASSEFRAAMTAFNSGRKQEAAGQFARFVEQHPSDQRAEDAAYLRVLALHAAGDVIAARGAASYYLRRYPSGFRRTEVERLAQ
ncbi:MAG: FecR domain-containing protein [Polyangiaceae bacterium]